ncbi:hypothetical protein HK097_002718 [Rhizophlyctis rosea]|uniref:Essential protein Yae1 N-terminal domain-containing protein n=1 Tax=Rhizophlyctis rosea TaxID=64517 RepID=A0AAD5X7S9_9FUNG|nr:hypothetical protein HK097_002718 [Rhizophlyctis rosea]
MSTSQTAQTLPSTAEDIENLVHLETMFEELGREDGLRDGAHSGAIQGRVSGVERGFQFAREAGFYGGVAELWLLAAQKGLVKVSSRAEKSLQSLHQQSTSFPLQNSSDPNLLDADPTVALDRLRGRYKVVSSSMGNLMKDQSYVPSANAEDVKFAF